MGTEEYLLQKAWKEGYEEGLAIGAKKLFVSNLLTMTDLDNERIAFLADVTVEFVQQVKTSAV